MSSDWYKDAIIYELHVKAFCDSNSDGIGDFPGLIQKLDYLQDLGINCIWLLPFYPSPFRDDGYDIASYKGINPVFGKMRDFRNLVREAHRRGLRVITELVINHTSDQHPWFQVARKSPPHSARRNRYVWSDSDKKYGQARIIFTDSEKSNWSWDPVAKAYYWHRFFHHQPDLNFDNPAVLREVTKVLRFWLDQEVDGMRLDAIPYLVEREGTNCENLPETHRVLKEIRRQVDLNYKDRMLLAEANQWPSDVRPYFGNGDECHMAFHFPLMTRMFMALRQEDRHPITDILRQTPQIPESCQWALFLRNHDELTLEMVTDEERDYMYRAYAADPQMRVNFGIRRRLAPLMNNSRRRIELLCSLLFSLRGTPIIYYGDEIGMGDNVYLGDRNGVRTPMQWSVDRNAGFSGADFAKLYLPPIMDTVYGYQAINVEAQQRDPSSLLQWMKRMIALRNRVQVFGRGSMEFLLPANRKILAYIRQHKEDTILCVANLSRFVQPFELDLSAYAGLTPTEMLGNIEFPRIGENPYFLSLGPHSFYWFHLQRVPETINLRIVEPSAEEPEAVPTLEIPGNWDSLISRNIAEDPDQDVFRDYLRRQRWFAGRTRQIKTVRVEDRIFFLTARPLTLLNLIHVEYSKGEPQMYLMPLVVLPPRSHFEKDQLLAKARSSEGEGLLVDGAGDDIVCRALLMAIADGLHIKTKKGVFSAVPGPIFQNEFEQVATPITVRRGLDEHSNTFVIFGDRLILKLFRKLEPGPNPEMEILQFLTENTSFDRAPRLAGYLQYKPRGQEAITLGLLQTLIPNQGDAWNYTLDELGRYFERVAGLNYEKADMPEQDVSMFAFAASNPLPPLVDVLGAYLQQSALLGRRTAELHLALARATQDSLKPELMTTGELNGLSQTVASHAENVIHALRQAAPSLSPSVQDVAIGLFDSKRIPQIFHSVAALPGGLVKTRIHGDYHLGQILWSKNDFYILNMSVEPDRPTYERNAKQSPVKDIANMLRSFSYAAYVALMRFTLNRPQDAEKLQPWARLWQARISASFLREYLSTAEGAEFLPVDLRSFRQLLFAFMLDKVFCEIDYELNNRPDWLRVPLAGLGDLIREAGV